jgi:hypothetical protein
LRRAEQLATWLDRRLIDPLVGLVLPGAGDLVTTGLGLYLVHLAWRLRLGAVVVARMLLNLAVDALLGSVPVAGDVFDLLHRANLRNLALLREHHLAALEGRRAKLTARDAALVVGAVLLFLVALAVPVTLLVLAVRRLAA